MIKQRLFTATLATALVAGLPAVTAAQEELLSPEAVDWTLSSYSDPVTAEVVTIPFGLQPSLRLEEGVASGFGGCNQFSGSYQIEGTSLVFSEEMSVTLALCEDDAQAIEDAYLAALGQVDGWTIDADVLELSDDFGEVILSLEVPSILWTTNQMANLMLTLEGLQTQVDSLSDEVVTLRADMEAQNVDRLRERIKTLESENKQVTKRLETLESEPKSSSGSGGSSTFTSAEKVLLEGIPGRIENFCTPLRSSLPKNTKAAVSCTPNTSSVASLKYYLLEGENAAAAYESVMSTFNVLQPASDTQTCAQGVKSQRQWVGAGWQADGCYRTNQRAEVRFIDNATECRKLKVGGKTLQSPAFYIELQGNDNDVEQVYSWATKGLDANSAQVTSLTVPIKRPNAAVSPSCPQ